MKRIYLFVIGMICSSATITIASESEPCSSLINYMLTPGGTCINLNTVSEDNRLEFERVEPSTLSPQSTSITGELTNIRSESEGIISYRHQDHSWVTSDGQTHIFARKELSSSSLSLYSQSKKSSNWKSTFSLPNTSYHSTSDGVVSSDNLLLTYSSSKNEIYFAELKFDNLNDSWKLIESHPIFTSSSLTGARPTIALGSDSRLWVAFTSRDSTTSKSVLKLFSSKSSYQVWQEFDISYFGSSMSDHISARVVTLTNGVAIIYSDDETLNWAYRSHSWPDGTWKTEKLIEYVNPKQQDPQGTHFSVVADKSNNIHVATNDGQNHLLYLKYDNNQNKWDTPRLLSSPNSQSATYMQISLSSSGDLFITYESKEKHNSNNFGYLDVLRSSDQGETFSHYSRLLYQPTINTGNPRIEAPSYIEGMLPIFQQVTKQDDSVQGLVYFHLLTQ